VTLSFTLTIEALAYLLGFNGRPEKKPGRPGCKVSIVI